MSKIIQTTVKELSGAIKNLFEAEFGDIYIAVCGELSEYRRHSSGHVYFTLKEDDCLLSGVLFSRYYMGLSYRPKQGDKVIITGKLSVYPPSGRYQLTAVNIEKAGLGEKHAKLEEVKRRLENQGYFSLENKKKIPDFCMNIGIVTARTGAAITDIVKTAHMRNPYVALTLISTPVQGEGAEISIAEAISVMDTLGMDCMIVGRGGGAADDLWAFNEEIVAHAIFNCKTPVISAVGHERDVSLSDLVADERAATPTAAAVRAVFSLDDFLSELSLRAEFLNEKMQNKLDFKAMKLDSLYHRLQKKDPVNVISEKKNKLSEYSARAYSVLSNRLISSQTKLEKLNVNLSNIMELKLHEADARLDMLQYSLKANIDKTYTNSDHRLKMLISKLDAMSPLRRLSGGYSYLEKNGKGIDSIEDIQSGDMVDIFLKNGRAKCLVEDIGEYSITDKNN